MTTVLSLPPDTVEVTVAADGGLTLPAPILDAMGAQQGDRFTLSFDNGSLVVTPNRVLARRALREIREGLAAAGITAEELQEEGQRIREERFRRRHGLG